MLLPMNLNFPLTTSKILLRAKYRLNWPISILMKKNILMAFIPLAFLTGCEAPGEPDIPEHPLFESSNASVIRDYATFAEYSDKTREMVAENRHFLTDDSQAEIQANSPLEVRPEHIESPDKGVILIHGLGDSPYSFVDVAPALAEQGYLVRTVLLPGHGTRPADMLKINNKDWISLVEKQVELLKEEVDDIYLGGFSTGGNLAYLNAANDPGIKGLMLFSPGFKSNNPRAPMLPLASKFRKWGIVGNPDIETNYARYRAMPVNGFAQFYHTSRKTRNSLKKNTFDRPVFMVLTEHDSVIETTEIKEAFHERFTHPESRLMWFGSKPDSREGRVHYVNSNMPEYQITNMSHMGILFSPDNPYYGIDGAQRICNNHRGARAAEDQEHCRAGKPVWFSAYRGLIEEGQEDSERVHARLTFNPVFETMMNNLNEVFES